MDPRHDAAEQVAVLHKPREPKDKDGGEPLLIHCDLAGRPAEVPVRHVHDTAQELLQPMDELLPRARDLHPAADEEHADFAVLREHVHLETQDAPLAHKPRHKPQQHLRATVHVVVVRPQDVVRGRRPRVPRGTQSKPAGAEPLGREGLHLRQALPDEELRGAVAFEPGAGSHGVGPRELRDAEHLLGDQLQPVRPPPLDRLRVHHAGRLHRVALLRPLAAGAGRQPARRPRPRERRHHRRGQPPPAQPGHLRLAVRWLLQHHAHVAALSRLAVHFVADVLEGARGDDQLRALGERHRPAKI
mmetsp:Transcript_3596/g.8582  ORF Transcript_3596/g.8582 Transcript_3596/m.8582 type:complete len:302 (+) Transcript_3596:4134-5039(+)